ncbi:MAG: pilin [Gammaproteobacteria bacterium]
MKRRTATEGFNVVELMITIAVVIVLAFFAVPAYQDYLRKAYFSEVISAAAPFKVAVGKCIQKHNTVTVCNAGSNGIPAGIAKPKPPVQSLMVDKGIITVTPVPSRGVLTTDNLVLTPIYDAAGGNVTWKSSGVGVDKKYSE